MVGFYLDSVAIQGLRLYLAAVKIIWTSERSRLRIVKPDSRDPGARPYHHGDLFDALARTAEELVRETGIHGFSLRECARRAGVAHSAPGHHFGDVSGLLTEVAARGFERLAARMQRHRAGIEGPEALERIARGYVDFALGDPVVFVLMFHSDRVDRGSPRCQRAGDAAFGELVSAVSSARGDSARDNDVLRFAWAAIHGIAMLLVDGPLMPAGGNRRGGSAELADGTIRRITHSVMTYVEPAERR
jgi:AcrR family transcriptional regulator